MATATNDKSNQSMALHVIIIIIIIILYYIIYYNTPVWISSKHTMQTVNTCQWKPRDPSFSRFVTIPSRDRRQTDDI